MQQSPGSTPSVRDPTPPLPTRSHPRHPRAGRGTCGREAAAAAPGAGCRERREHRDSGMAAGAHLGGSGKRGAIPAHLRRRKPGRRGGRAASRGTAGARPLPAPRGSARPDTGSGHRGKCRACLSEPKLNFLVDFQVSLTRQPVYGTGFEVVIGPPVSPVKAKRVCK